MNEDAVRIEGGPFDGELMSRTVLIGCSVPVDREGNALYGRTPLGHIQIVQSTIAWREQGGFTNQPIRLRPKVERDADGHEIWEVIDQ